MAKWKMMGQMAIAIREAEKAAEQKRILEEQSMESVRNSKIYRKLARDRARIVARSRAPTLRDAQIMAVLEAEADTNHWDSQVARCERYKEDDARHMEMITESVNSKDASMAEIARLKEQMHLIKLKDKTLDKEIYETKMKLKEFNRKAAQVHVAAPDKVIRRQEVIQQALGRQLEENRILREQMDHLEFQQAKVDHVQQELERDCEQLSTELAEYSEVAKVTYDGRDLNLLNIAKLKDHLEKSTTSFQADMQLTQFKIDVLRRLDRFMTCKNKVRDDEGPIRRLRQRSHQSVSEKDSCMFRTALEGIRAELDHEDTNVIISTFIQLEEENYMLFKNISETREAIHNMMLDTEKVKAQIDDVRHTRQISEQEHFARKVELMDKAEMCKKEADKKEEYIKKADQVIQVYIKGILAMLRNLGETEEKIAKLSGVFHTAEERNIPDFLAELERYINKLYDLKTLSDFLAYDSARRTAGIPPEPLPPRLALQQRVVVVPPVHEEGDDIDDPALPTEAAFRPLTITEISRHVDEDLENRQRREELGVPIPSPTMTDATSEAIGDKPTSPALSKHHEVDIF